MAMKEKEKPQTGTVSDEEVARFTAIAEQWWDPWGKFRPLHQLTPPRVAFIRHHLTRHFDRGPAAEARLDGLQVLDVGCGGGLLSEPVRRMGAQVTGIDAGEKNIAIARLHAKQEGLDIDYQHARPEDIAAQGRTFDAVLNMEVVEHVPNANAYLEATAALVKPGGVMALSTLNRTIKALAFAKIGAEYVLRWLPKGAHDWNKFVKPSELAAGLRGGGMDIVDLKGIGYNLLTGEWFLTSNLEVNYLALATKDPEQP